MYFLLIDLLSQHGGKNINPWVQNVKIMVCVIFEISGYACKCGNGFPAITTRRYN
jgi:hypothetical protein